MILSLRACLRCWKVTGVLANCNIYQACQYSDDEKSKQTDKSLTVPGESKTSIEDPVRKTYRILKDDLVRLSRGEFTYQEKIPKHVDIAIIGGGIIGSSVAYWLKQRAPDSFSLMVAERDSTYTRSSTALSVGGIRQQFSLPENVQLSMFSAQFLRNIKQHLSVLDHDPPDICFQPHGYLFLASEAGVEQMEENHRLQIDLGAKVELLTAKQLSQKFPWLNTDGIALGSYGVGNEGWFDPWALLCAFRRKASSLGAKYVDGEVIGFEFEYLSATPFDETDDPHIKVHTLLLKDDKGEIHSIEFAILIVAGGPYSAEIAKMLKIGSGPGILKVPLPVEPRKRYVYVFHCEDGPGIDFPLLIDKSGTYARREGLGGNYIGGKSPIDSEEPEINNLDVDYNFFDNSVWPTLAHRIPAFEKIKMSSAWAGYYDYNTFDQNGIVGIHPYYHNVLFATGFSGHGIQMSPGVGRAIMEIILDGSYKTIDLNRFGLDRIFFDDPLLEKNIV